MKREIHFFQLEYADYDDMAKAGQLNDDYLYFCHTSGGFCLFMGKEPLVLADAPTTEGDTPQPSTNA